MVSMKLYNQMPELTSDKIAEEVSTRSPLTVFEGEAIVVQA